jgi:peptidyl-prolyl cis-trans isomerase B (cyclophilin B)
LRALEKAGRSGLQFRTREERAMKRWRTICVAVAGLALAAAAASGKEEKNPVILMSTSMGDVKIELDRAKAPKTVDNFLAYVKAKHYDGTIFHRVIPGFMIQGGGMDKDMNEKKTNAPIENEAGNGLKNTVGTLAMARTSDPNSATAQFFINVKDNAFLDHRDNSQAGFGYAVFGKVVDGMDVVKKIENVKTANKLPHQNVPVEPVVITSMKIVEGE